MVCDHCAGEKHIEIVGDDLFQKNNRAHRVQFRQLGWDIHKAGQTSGHLDPGKLVAAGFRVLDEHRNVEAQVADKGKRMSRVHSQGGKYSKDKGLKVVGGPVLLATVELCIVENLHTVLPQCGDEIMFIVLLLLL